MLQFTSLLTARVLHFAEWYILCEEEFFTKAFLARGVWLNLQAQDQKESSALQPEFILKCESYFLLPVIAVECCRALDHVGGFRNSCL